MCELWQNPILVSDYWAGSDFIIFILFSERRKKNTAAYSFFGQSAIIEQLAVIVSTDQK